MYYKKEKNESGDYIDIEGVRYFTNECNEAYTPKGLNIGFTFFETKEEMMNEWKLKEIPLEEKNKDSR